MAFAQVSLRVEGTEFVLATADGRTLRKRAGLGAGSLVMMDSRETRHKGAGRRLVVMVLCCTAQLHTVKGPPNYSV